LLEKNPELHRFFKQMIRFRLSHPVLRRQSFFSNGGGITWHGERENEPDWSDETRWLAFLLDGGKATHPDGRQDDDIYVILNAADEWRHFVVPDRGREWRKVVDTSRPSPEDIFENWQDAPQVGHRQDRFAVEPRSVVILINPRS
ncbi:MAG: glycogen debranching enzyme, partial [Planctomycetes bacterium]|nr:glycogen debranching enzyme [Planctomycetota bacterium]